MNAALKSWCNEIKRRKITEKSQRGREGERETARGENKKEKEMLCHYCWLSTYWVNTPGSYWPHAVQHVHISSYNARLNYYWFTSVDALHSSQQGDLYIKVLLEIDNIGEDNKICDKQIGIMLSSQLSHLPDVTDYNNKNKMRIFN